MNVNEYNVCKLQHFGPKYILRERREWCLISQLQVRVKKEITIKALDLHP